MGKWISAWSTFLFARPSFLEGIARTMDLGGALQEYNYSYSGEAADMRAMYADWRAIGDDLRRAIAEISEQGSVQLADQVIAEAYDLLQTSVSQASPDVLEAAKE